MEVAEIDPGFGSEASEYCRGSVRSWTGGESVGVIPLGKFCRQMMERPCVTRHKAAGNQR